MASFAALHYCYHKRKRASETPKITIWTWEDAPQEYKKLSGHGKNEDWVVTVPKSLHKSKHIPGFTDVIGCWGETSIN